MTSRWAFSPIFRLLTSSKGIVNQGMNANDLVHFMKKRKYEEKSKSLITNQLEIISFEKLNKTIDIYDLLKPKYEGLIKEALVNSFKEIAFLKMYKEDMDTWFYSEKVYFFDSKLFNKRN